MYGTRLECFPELQARLSIYADDPRFIKEFTDAIIMLQYSCITDKVSNKMHNDIFPTLMKKQKEINSLSPQELKARLTENGENPDWIDKKTQKSMKEIGNLQLEGADIYMSTFRYMKGYSFFNKLHHWFSPFDPKSPYVTCITGGDDSAGSIFSLIMSNNVFCNSDLYSFCFMLNSMGVKDKDMISSQIDAQISEEDKDLLSAKINSKKALSAKEECRKYIFDFYRFFVCYPFYTQFDNPFKKTAKSADGTTRQVTFSPLETEAFHFLTNHKEEMLNIAEFFMRKEFYQEALDMYNVINPQPIEDDANIWQKIGFCRQKLGKEKAAYKAYILADELLPDSRWTMTHIAQLSQKLEIYDTAINYYDMLLQQDNENIRFITNKAICQMKSGHYEEAIPTLFQGYYLDEESLPIQQNMIECYMHTGQLDKAQEMISKVIANEDCHIEIRILNAFLALKNISNESAYYYVREAMSFFSVKENDGHSFNYYYYYYLSEYADVLNIDQDIARMLLDSVNLDIR